MEFQQPPVEHGQDRDSDSFHQGMPGSVSVSVSRVSVLKVIATPACPRYSRTACILRVSVIIRVANACHALCCENFFPHVRFTFRVT